VNRGIVAVTIVTSLFGACAGEEPLRIGTKNFAEQRILGALLQQLLAAAQQPVRPPIDCGGTFDCHQALRSGRIDLLVEYTGTGWLHLRGRRDQPQRSLPRLRHAYREIGLEWLEPLGFDNGYLLVMPTHRAVAQQLRTISDLSKIAGGLRLACPADFVRRPRDGLASLLEHHGLRQRAAPLVLEQPAERLQAVEEGRADVAVLFGTDGALAARSLAVLEDSLAFFPPYRAVIVVRAASLKRHRGLKRALQPLAGKIETETMRRANYEVQVEGRSPSSVAARLLRREKLIGSAAPRAERVPEVLLAAGQASSRSFTSVAVRAVRAAWPDRPVRVERVRDPAAALAEGTAALAVVDAASFFRPRRKGFRRRRELEAAVVVGRRLIHVLRRHDEGRGLEGRLGLGEMPAGEQRLLRELLATRGLDARTFPSRAALIEALDRKTIDAALLLSPSGEALVARFLSDARRTLAQLQPAASDPPYLRVARIPGETYRGQPLPVETLSEQMVLAAPAPQHGRATQPAGPFAALGVRSPPLTPARLAAMARGAGIAEVPDPVLPSIWNRGALPAGQPPATRIVDRVINVLAIAFAAWLLLLVFRRPDASP
jgi:glycine betaine/choline ABC-type transport system substrate-binding protein